MQNPDAVDSRSQLRTGHLELLGSQAKEERPFPIRMYLYFTPTFLNSVFPEASFTPKRDQISFFSTGFYENRWGDSGLCSTSHELKTLWKTKPCRKAKKRHTMRICGEIYCRKFVLSLPIFLPILPVSASQMASLGVRGLLATYPK